MSKVRELDDDEEAELIDDPELEAELEAGIAEADANPGARIELGELIRRLRNGE